MKIAIVAVILITAWPCCGQSLKMIESGAIAWISKSEREWTAEEKQIGPWFDGLMTGFRDGVFGSMQIPKKGGPSELTLPDEWMYDNSKFALSLLVYIRENEPKGFIRSNNQIGGLLLMAWYLSHHSASGEEEKEKARRLIVQYFKEKDPVAPTLSDTEKKALIARLNYLKKLRDEYPDKERIRKMEDNH